MKIIQWSLASALVILCTGLVLAEEPGLKKGARIKDGSGDMKLAYDSNPCVVDWNNDGLKDLLVGQYTQGHITLFRNQGTDLNPVFNGGALILSNGSPITVSYG